jgi:hypothetical protein
VTRRLDAVWSILPLPEAGAELDRAPRPPPRHLEQADGWTWLVLLAYTRYTQLRLARRAIQDRHLPWEPLQRPRRSALTPARTRQAFPHTPRTLPRGYSAFVTR